MILLLNYLIAILVFVVIYLFEKLILLWIKKKPLLPFVNWAILVDAIAREAAIDKEPLVAQMEKRNKPRFSLRAQVKATIPPSCAR